MVRAEVVPADPDADGGTVGLGEAGAAEIARWLRREQPVVMAIGTGRTLKAGVRPPAAPELQAAPRGSLTGNIGPDGSAAYYNVIFSMAEAVDARHFPMPLPVFVASPEEREMLHGLAMIRSTLALAAAADVAFVGIGEMDDAARLLSRSFPDGGRARGGARRRGGRRDCGWIFDRDGRLLRGGAAERTASAPIPGRDRATVMALAKGRRKLPALRAALRGGLVNGLVTDEATAEALRPRSSRKSP